MDDPRFRGFKPGDRVVAMQSITYRPGLVVEQGTFGTIADLDGRDPYTPVLQVAWDGRSDVATTSADNVDRAPPEAFVREPSEPEPLVRVRIAV